MNQVNNESSLAVQKIVEILRDAPIESPHCITDCLFGEYGIDKREDEFPILVLTCLLAGGNIFVRVQDNTLLSRFCDRLGRAIEATDGLNPFSQYDASSGGYPEKLLVELHRKVRVLKVCNVGMLDARGMTDLSIILDESSSALPGNRIVIASQEFDDRNAMENIKLNIHKAFMMNISLDVLPSDIKIKLLVNQKLAQPNISAIPPSLLASIAEKIRLIPVDEADVLKLIDFSARLEGVTRQSRRLAPPLQASSNLLAAVRACAFILEALTGRDVKPDWGLMSLLAPYIFCHQLSLPDGAIENTEKIVGEALNNSGAKISAQSFSLEEARPKIIGLKEALKVDVKGRDKDEASEDGITPGDLEAGSRTVSTLDLVVTALLANGHVLLEDFPGTGKSFLAEKLGALFEDDVPEFNFDVPTYRRIQCTPDMLPGDVTGSIMMGENKILTFRHGPVFAYILLLDEINRTTPKVQSALLEAMAERNVTVDGNSYPLGEVFFVIATMNPLDKVGTFPLPQAQLDRFIFKRTLPPIIDPKILEEIALMPDKKNRLEMNAGTTSKDSGHSTGGKIKISEISRIQDLVNPPKDRKGKITDEFEQRAAMSALFELSENLAALTAGDPSFLFGDKHASTRGVRPTDAKHRILKFNRDGDYTLKPGSRPSPRTLQRFLKALRAYAFVSSCNQGGVSAGQIVVKPQIIRSLARDFLRHRIFPERSDASASEQMNRIHAIIDEVVDITLENSASRDHF